MSGDVRPPSLWQRPGVQAAATLIASALIAFNVNKLNPNDNANNGYIQTWSASGSQVAGLHSNGNMYLSGAIVPTGGLQATRYVPLTLCSGSTACATGSGVGLPIPPALSGSRISAVYLDAVQPGVTGTMTVNIKNYRYNNTDIQVLSTPLSLDTTEESSVDAASPAVINTSNDNVHGHDKLVCEVTAVHSTPAQGVTCSIELSPS